MNIYRYLMKPDKNQKSKLSDDSKTLILDNFDFTVFKNQYKNIDPHTKYDYLFDLLNYYNIIETIEIKSDNITKIPKNIMKFGRLNSLVISGENLRYININQIPSTIEILFIDSKTIKSRFLYGVKHFVPKLRILGIDMQNIYLKDIDFPLPYMPKLQKLYLYNPVFDLIPDMMINYKSHDMRCEYDDNNSNNVFSTLIEIGQRNSDNSSEFS